jgi:hypothetical protein
MYASTAGRVLGVPETGDGVHIDNRSDCHVLDVELGGDVCLEGGKADLASSRGWDVSCVHFCVCVCVCVCVCACVRVLKM